MWWIISILIYLCPLAFIVYKTRWVKDMNDFSLANRKIPALLLFASISATFIGPGYSIGFISNGYHWGVVYFIFGVAYASQNILVGYFIAPKLRECNESVSSLGSFFEYKTKKIYIQKIIGVISVGICIGFSAVMLVAGKTYYSYLFNDNVNAFIGVFAIAFLTLIYTLSGGLKASIFTDVFQFIFFISFISVAVLFIIYNNRLSSADLTNSTVFLTENGLDQYSTPKLIGTFFLFLLGETLIPPYANRAFASKSKQSAKWGFLLSGIFSFVWFFFMVLIGILAFTVLNGIETEKDKELFYLVATTHPIISNCIGIAVICIIMSSLDSLVNAGAISLWRDFFYSKKFKILPLNITRIAVVIIILIASIIALYMDGIIEGLLLFYSIWAPAILPSLTYIIFDSKPNHIITTLSILSGTFCAIILKYWPATFDKEYVPCILGLFAGIIPIVAFKILKKLKK